MSICRRPTAPKSPSPFAPLDRFDAMSKGEGVYRPEVQRPAELGRRNARGFDALAKHLQPPSGALGDFSVMHGLHRAGKSFAIVGAELHQDVRRALAEDDFSSRASRPLCSHSVALP